MTSPFNPRDVEVLAAALPPEEANPIGRAARDVLVLHAKRLTPGQASFNEGPFRQLFFPKAGPSPHEGPITELTGLADDFFTGLANAMVCQQIWVATTKLKPQMDAGPIALALAQSTIRLRQQSYRYYAYTAAYADSPVRTALAAFPDPASKALAKEHYLRGITSPTWVNDKLLQDSSGNWQNRDWELFHHWIKLLAVGASVGEIDTAINTVVGMGLPVPLSLRPGTWVKQGPWLAGDFSGSDVAEATETLLKTSCYTVGIPPVLACQAEMLAYDFTSRDKPGWAYRTPPPSGSCFAAGAQVVLADGTLRPIEQVAIGDELKTPDGPRRVILHPEPYLGERELLGFDGIDLAFVPSHPFLLDASGDATYAAADPGSLARIVPTLSQFGIRPLSGKDPAVLVRHQTAGDQPFPAPKTHPVSRPRPLRLHDLYLEVGPDGRSEYYIGDEHTQLLVSSEVPRFAAAPETAQVILHVLRSAAPTILGALASTPDSRFADLLCVGLDSLLATMLPTIGPHLSPDDSVVDAAALAAAVRGFAAALDSSGSYDTRMGTLVEQFAARFAPQFQAVLALPWRSYDLADEQTADLLSVTLFSIELFRSGPPTADAHASVTLARAHHRLTRRLPVSPGAPADHWYYPVDVPAYFPEWSPPGPAALSWLPGSSMSPASPASPEDQLWHLELSLLPEPHSGCRASLPLPRTLSHGYQTFDVPLTDRHHREVGRACLDARLLTLEAYAAETRTRLRSAPGSLATRLATLASDFTITHFPAALKAFSHLS